MGRQLVIIASLLTSIVVLVGMGRERPLFSAESSSTNVCADPGAIETYKKLLNASGMSDDDIRAAGGSPFTLFVSGGRETDDPHVFKCFVTIHSDFLRLMGKPEGAEVVFEVELLDNGKEEVTLISQ